MGAVNNYLVKGEKNSGIAVDERRENGRKRSGTPKQLVR